MQLRDVNYVNSVYCAIIYAPNACFRFPICCSLSKPECLVTGVENGGQITDFFHPS